MFKKLINYIYLKIFKINDSAQRIALGMGIGVFAGLIPGTGPAAALFLAFIFKANRAAALLGSLLTNTWLSVVTFILAIKVGSVILKMNWHDVQQKAQVIIKDFHWGNLFKLSFLNVFLPVIIGYIIIGLMLGVLAYFLTLLIIRRYAHGNQEIYP